MTEIHEPLSRLGLSQYAERFIEEGFDSWEAILHVTESDLDQLGVKLGHRRILQREIAYARGVSVEQLSSPTRAHQPEDTHAAGLQEGVKSDGQLENAPRGKRKYRRHPKIDENAPERPSSAYVIFSNKIRDELKPRNLSFTEIAKCVGERWQSITAEEKGPHEQLAMELKEKYHKEMNAYKLTENYRLYQEYLADFKLKYSNVTDGKKPRLDHEDSRDSTGSHDSSIPLDGPSHSHLGNAASEPRRRVDSVGSTEPRMPLGSFPSPMSAPNRQVGGRGGLATILPHSSISPMSTSPSSPSIRRDSSSGPVPTTALLSRPSQEPNTEPSSYSTVNQRIHRNSPYGDGPTNRSGSLGPSVDSRLSRTRENNSPMDEQRPPLRPLPSLVHQSTSSSSNLSLGSVMSTPNTSASSIYPAARNVEDSDRPQLPPLSAKGFQKPSGNMADYALRPAQQQPSSGNTTPNIHHNLYQSSFNTPPPYPGVPDIPPIGSLRNVKLQELSDQNQPTPLSQTREQRDSPLQPLAPILPSLHPGLSAIPRDSQPTGPDTRPEQDRLAFLADVAYADQDRRSGP